MDHLSYPSTLHRRGERADRSTVGEVDLEEDRVADPRGVARRQVVCHQHVPARGAQQPDDVCADVTGTTCHEHGHESTLVERPRGAGARRPGRSADRPGQACRLVPASVLTNDATTAFVTLPSARKATVQVMPAKPPNQPPSFTPGGGRRRPEDDGAQVVGDPPGASARRPPAPYVPAQSSATPPPAIATRSRAPQDACLL